ncbi:Carbohydrate binding family 6 [Methanosphaerula palustris E1-9c]|uniref:Carbohydrate binding family 6 n=2 Tax=Methanosphaerula palustris TaxID=475088 RepID=B8GJZ2_METPE|nr:Carbohydrate binding family 6 [Methanosphaerula palustris E1-9c]
MNRGFGRWYNWILGCMIILLLLVMVMGGASAQEVYAGVGISGVSNNSSSAVQLPVMHQNDSTLKHQIDQYETAPTVSLDTAGVLKARLGLSRSQNLLPYLDYNAIQRDQNPTGNCWVWVGTGLMEITHQVEDAIRDPLSIQYFDSTYHGGAGLTWAGNGGTLADFVNFYQQQKIAVPASNTNASFKDNTYWCNDNNQAWVKASDIATDPHYSIASIQEQKIPTRSIGTEAAIANIKTVLDSNKGVYFAFRLPNEQAWNDFNKFWLEGNQSAVWNPDLYDGNPWESWSGGSHAVLCVGYQDTDPANRYWIMLNSWGNAFGNRPSGLFRVKMDIDYDAMFTSSMSIPATEWETIDMNYSPSPQSTSIEKPYTTHTVPCRVEAEDYDYGGENISYYDTTSGNSGKVYRNDDVDIEQTTQAGGFDVGWVRNGEWLQYTLDVPEAGDYEMRIRSSSPGAGDQIVVSVDGIDAGTLIIPQTDSFDNYTNVSLPVKFSAGRHLVRLTFAGDRQNIDYFEINPAIPAEQGVIDGKISLGSTPSGATVFLDNVLAGMTPLTIPSLRPGSHHLDIAKSGYQTQQLTTVIKSGETQQMNVTLLRSYPAPYVNHTLPALIEAEDYNLGGEGIAYHDTTAWNEGSVYRNDGVDIEQIHPTGGYKVCWIRDGEWLTYTVTIPQAGNYTVIFTGCSITPESSCTLSIDDTTLTTVSLPDTGSSDRFGTVQRMVSLPAGVHLLKLSFIGRQDVDNLQFVAAGLQPQVSSTTVATPAPILETPTVSPSETFIVRPTPSVTFGQFQSLPGQIQAEDFDTGGEMVAYHDTTSENLGESYRDEGVDIIFNPVDGSNSVTDIEPGEWIRYPVNITESGVYNASFRVAANVSGSTVDILIDDSNLSAVQVPDTGSLSSFTWITRQIWLPAGQHMLRLKFSGPLSIDTMKFTP